MGKLTALVPLLILLQIAAVPVPRYLVKLDGPGAKACCRTFGHCCPAAEPACDGHVGSCPRAMATPCGGGTCCETGAAASAEAPAPAADADQRQPAAPNADRQSSDERTPVSCCLLCQCGIGLHSPPLVLPLGLNVASFVLPSGPALTSVDAEPVTPPPKPSMSC